MTPHCEQVPTCMCITIFHFVLWETCRLNYVESFNINHNEFRSDFLSFLSSSLMWRLTDDKCRKWNFFVTQLRHICIGILWFCCRSWCYPFLFFFVASTIKLILLMRIFKKDFEWKSNKNANNVDDTNWVSFMRGEVGKVLTYMGKLW